MNKLFRVSALGVLLASPTVPSAFETAAFAQAQPAPAQAPLAPQPALWNRAAAQALLDYIDDIGSHGLNSSDYRADRLRSALSSGDDSALGAAATDSFMRLSGDLSGGHVPMDARLDWHMPSTRLSADAQRELMARAVSSGDVEGALNGLLPIHPQYNALRRALGRVGEDPDKVALIRTNLERWRWMPRQLGARHVLVNVPAYTAALVDNGRVTARHRTVVGAVRTPTPQLSATIRAVTFNPYWHVPQSIIREMGGRFGADYEVTRSNGAITARQKPGPRNSLGRVKIEMPNDHAIYLHDTPSQSLFARPARAFSHGCIRTQNVRDFAALLLAPTGQWQRPQIDQQIDTGRTLSASLASPVPVFIAYFTAAATDDGELVPYRDIYGRDAPVRAAL